VQEQVDLGGGEQAKALGHRSLYNTPTVGKTPPTTPPNFRAAGELGKYSINMNKQKVLYLQSFVDLQ
jgi:hypothetical protein